jgi:hypothetical protein
MADFSGHALVIAAGRPVTRTGLDGAIISLAQNSGMSLQALTTALRGNPELTEAVATAYAAAHERAGIREPNPVSARALAHRLGRLELDRTSPSPDERAVVDRIERDIATAPEQAQTGRARLISDVRRHLDQGTPNSIEQAGMEIEGALGHPPGHPLRLTAQDALAIVQGISPNRVRALAHGLRTVPGAGEEVRGMADALERASMAIRTPSPA